MAIAKANVNVRIDVDVKERASQILAKMGIDQTTAIDMFYRQVITECSLPFKPSVEPSLEEQVMAALEKNPAKEYTLDTDENGNMLIDKDLHPELYDWAVNG